MLRNPSRPAGIYGCQESHYVFNAPDSSRFARRPLDDLDVWFDHDELVKNLDQKCDGDPR
ncbi:hypothetical protein [Burkholderia sp. L27(2015)]|uniref:hypothetical protein n=1 Tax=Burkholderia sp. L27(2015) TaxID=1641858 RepID=UPI00131E7066|nr:hypothetical protein [Burkholderia sp. L27(2015)]